MSDGESKRDNADISDQADQGPLDSLEESPEQGTSPQEAKPPGPSRQELVETVHKLRKEAKAVRERMLRIAADGENLRKRLQKERTEFQKYSQENLLRDLLGPLDNLERTLEHVPDQDEPVLNSLKQGLEMVLRQFREILAKHHLVSFSALGERFDPSLHEALQRQETTEAPAGTIISEMHQGYKLHDRLLRPALVTVACAPGTKSDAEGVCAQGDDQASKPSGSDEEPAS